MADAQMQFLYESAGRRWYFAAPGQFARPGLYFWNGTTNVHIDDALAGVGEQATGGEVPEGCTPADARMLRAANHALAQESHELQEALADLYQQVKRFAEVEGEADFETGRALYLLSRLRPLEFNWPFTEPPAGAPKPAQAEPVSAQVAHEVACDHLHEAGFHREEDWFIRRDPNDDDSAECIHIDTIAIIAEAGIKEKP